MSKHLRRLIACETVVHGPIQVIRNLCDLTSRNQRSHGDETAIARCKCGPQPQVAKEELRGVLDYAR